jgi:2-polyprenyl-6-methoxyphenol hydroxylase-like FAD-dependent oxidoreductase
MLLARKGLKVLVLDRARFPADIPHGHFIHRHGPRRLHKWGILDRIVESNCPPVTGITMDLGDFALVGTDLIRDGIALGFGPRRHVVDTLLIQAATDAGAEFRQGVSVEEYLGDGTTVNGVRYRDHHNSSHGTELARIVIGADGRHSSLARAVEAPQYDAFPSLTCWYFSYWSGVPIANVEVYLRGRTVIFIFPTNDALTAVFIAWDVAEFPRVKANIQESFQQALERVPELGQRMRGGKREERFYGTADVPNFFRKPFGPGWALVGDAGHHKDPFLALGMCDALRDAELLASAIEEGFSGIRAVDDALSSYERQRNEASMSEYRENIHMAQFKPLPPDLVTIRRGVRANQEDTNKFFMARQGMIPREEFFNPENLQRLKARAAATS